MAKNRDSATIGVLAGGLVGGVIGWNIANNDSVDRVIHGGALTEPKAQAALVETTLKNPDGLDNVRDTIDALVNVEQEAVQRTNGQRADDLMRRQELKDLFTPVTQQSHNR